MKILAMQRGICGAANLNQVLQEAMNPSKIFLRRGGTQYRLHDKVMQIRNNYDKEVFNGDIGTICKVDMEERELTVDYEGREVLQDVSELEELVLAYATTIHKAQGSEQPENIPFIAAMLREQKTGGMASSKSGTYSLKELDALGQYVSSLSVLAAKANLYEMNEERIGLDLAVLAMKTDTLKKDGNMGSLFQSTLQKAFDGYLDAFLEQFDRRLEENRKKARTASDIQGNTGLNKDAVWSVYHKTMEQYRISGNTMKAFIKGAEYGKAQYAKKMSSGQYKEIYRYKNSSGYWNNFFGDAPDRKTSSYEKKGNTFEQYMMGWMDFKNSLSEESGIRMNLSLKSIDAYAISQNGNWVSANIQRR